jgi:hypothetical protein
LSLEITLFIPLFPATISKQERHSWREENPLMIASGIGEEKTRL